MTHDLSALKKREGNAEDGNASQPLPHLELRMRLVVIRDLVKLVAGRRGVVDHA